MSFQTSRTIPYRRHQCPKCVHLLGSGPRGACSAYETPSWPTPLAGQFRGEDRNDCPSYSPKNIFVMNLSPDVSDEDLRQAFQAFGRVRSYNVIRDEFTGESRGIGFVEMPNKDEADRAISELNGKDLKGRTLKVNAAGHKRDRSRGRSG